MASDAVHYWKNINLTNPFPIVVDVEKMLEGYETLLQLSDSIDHIIPGHDPKVIHYFPTLETCTNIALLHEQPLVNSSISLKTQEA